MKLSNIDIKEITSKIVESVHPEKVLLFGSYANDTVTKESDLDLLIVMQSDRPLYKRSSTIRHLFWPPKIPMDILVYTPAEVEKWNGTQNHIITNAFKNGKILYAS